MKAWPETHSTCTGNQVPRYLARSQDTIWYWNPVILSLWCFDIDQWSHRNGDAPMQLNNVINDDVRTRPMILHDAMFWSRPTKPQMMRLRYQLTMLNINFATDDDDALILINDVTHDDDVSILINMLQIMVMLRLLNLAKRMKTRFKDTNTWSKKWRWN